MKTDMKDVSTWIPKALFEAYCGPQTDNLSVFYDKAVEKQNQMTWSLNWFALLLMPAWLGYRKQWNLLATLTIMVSSVFFIEAFFNLNLGSGILLGALFGLALMANGLLLMNAHGEFIKLIEQGLGAAEIKAALQDLASPSIPMAIAGFLGYTFVIINAAALADKMFGLPY